MNHDFWRRRRVFITGHTGFKGSWLTQWLKLRGAVVTGFSLDPPTRPSLFDVAKVAAGIDSIHGDVRDGATLRSAVLRAQPEVVFHLAAQSLVRPSYEDPAGTYATNVMGTANLLDAVREAAGVRVAMIVTSDKCYEHSEGGPPHREDDPMGGSDPYSSSKGCAELVTTAYRRSFFTARGSPRVVSVRAGNVIGGGDWARDRLIPDLVRAFSEGAPAMIRNPGSSRPWQFVLDPLRGYLRIAEQVWDDESLPHAWNLGPEPDDVLPVRWIADRMAAAWGNGASWQQTSGEHPHETTTLRLDSSRAQTLLGWTPRLDAGTAVDWTAEWYKTWLADPSAASAVTMKQIERFDA